MIDYWAMAGSMLVEEVEGNEIEERVKGDASSGKHQSLYLASLEHSLEMYFSLRVSSYWNYHGSIQLRPSIPLYLAPTQYLAIW